MNYVILDPALRNTFPGVWLGMDLRGMALGQQFIGCRQCGVQFTNAARVVSVNQCPVCLGSLKVFYVTQADLDAAREMEAK